MKSVYVELVVDEIFGDEDAPLLVKLDHGDGKKPDEFWIPWPRAGVLLEQVTRRCIEVRLIQTLERLERQSQSLVAKAA